MNTDFNMLANMFDTMGIKYEVTTLPNNTQIIAIRTETGHLILFRFRYGKFEGVY